MKHNIREYNSRGIAGLVVRIKHPSGVERSVYVAEQCGMESDEPWLAVCETHGKHGELPNTELGAREYARDVVV